MEISNCCSTKVYRSLLNFSISFQHFNVFPEKPSKTEKIRLKNSGWRCCFFSPLWPLMNFRFRNETFLLAFEFIIIFHLIVSGKWIRNSNGKYSLFFRILVVVCHFTLVLRCWMEFMTFRFLFIFALIWWNYPPYYCHPPPPNKINK